MRSAIAASVVAFVGTACIVVTPPPAPSAATGEDAAAVAATPANVERGQVTFLLGAQQLDEDDWAPTDEPIVFGAELTQQKPGAWAGFEVGTRLAGDSATVNGVDVSLVSWELYGGARRTFFTESDLQPYIGAGITLLLVALEGDSGWNTTSDEDVSLGAYVHAGCSYRIDQLLLGLDVRLVGGTDVDLYGYSSDMDSTQVCLFVGFGL
ncbi:MAG: hypothetical protein HUU28_08835 [Planctomycetaceae bacterium]|nr:hypothetical protein [Planctomycetaceae bacterium]